MTIRVLLATLCVLALMGCAPKNRDIGGETITDNCRKIRGRWNAMYGFAAMVCPLEMDGARCVVVIELNNGGTALQCEWDGR